MNLQSIFMTIYQKSKGKKVKIGLLWRFGLTFIIVLILKAYSMSSNHIFSF